jgi:hypothetical protein
MYIQAEPPPPCPDRAVRGLLINYKETIRDNT